MAKAPTISETIDQNTLTQVELDDVVAILRNANYSADYKVALIEAIVLPKETVVEG